MFNRTSFFTRLLFNRAGTTEPSDFAWRATVEAESIVDAQYERRRQLSAKVQADTPDYTFYLPRVEHVYSAVIADGFENSFFIRQRPFASEVQGESFANQPNIYGLNVDYIKFVGLTLVAGDELIIDTDHMTATLNGVNVIQYVTDDSTFFPIHAEDQIEISGNGQAAVVVQWKDRWY